MLSTDSIVNSLITKEKKTRSHKNYKQNLNKFVSESLINNAQLIYKIIEKYVERIMAQIPALIPKEVEIQRLKKIYIMVIMLGSIAASVEVDNFVDGSLHQTAIRDSAFTPAHWWLYSHFVALPLGWGFVAMYDRRVPILRGPNNSMNTGLKITIIGYLATMFTIGINEMWHFWFVEEIFAVPNHWMFNMGVVVAFMGALAYVVRVYARLVELGAETPAKNPYVAEMYKLALEGKLYSRSIP
jgi:methane/ammonia monooxygenase subunit C